MKLQTIKLLPLLCVLGFCAPLAVEAWATEYNTWPFWVGETAGETAAPIDSWSAAGPFIFHQPVPAPGAPDQSAGGFRPFFVQKTDPARGRRDAYFLYPLFTYRSTPTGHHWSFLSLINQHSDSDGPHPGMPSAERNSGGFDLWPVYFSRETENPDTTYHAIFPLYGSVTKRFGMDRWTWVLFPLYGRFEKRHVVTTTAPWPFVKILQGEGNHGFDLWPLFGWRAKEGAYRERYYLWPLIYKDEHALWLPKPDVKLGFLPFYAREESPAATSETYLWPFFGYTNRTAPVHYREVRYFWPLFVQGRGDNKYVNRWGPFYTHSVRKGVDKTWVLWPLWCRQTWTASGLNQTRDRVVWFFYLSNEQRSARNPALAPARKTHVWPLVSVWNNGAGRRQVQALSPLAPLFPENEPIQLVWNPIFALYRFDQQAPDDRRHSLLWNFVTYRHAPDQREFHLGPLLSVDSGAHANRIALGCGLLGIKRETPDSRWRLFAFQFSRRTTAAASSKP